MESEHRGCQPAKHNQQAPTGIKPLSRGLPCWHLSRAVLSTAAPQVQGRKPGPALQLPEARAETCAHTFQERLCPCSGILGAPGPQPLWLLGAPHSGPAPGKRHARASCYTARRSSGLPRPAPAPAAPGSADRGCRVAPRPRQQALPDILRVWEGEASASLKAAAGAGGRVRAGRMPRHPQPPPP